MPDQVRHDDFETFYEVINFIIENGFRSKKRKRKMVMVVDYRSDIAHIYVLLQKIKANRLILSLGGRKTATQTNPKSAIFFFMVDLEIPSILAERVRLPFSFLSTFLI